MGVRAEFKHAPGELVDVPHLCIDGGLIKLAVVGRHGGKGYVVESVSMGKAVEVMVFEECVSAAEVRDE